VWPGISPVNVWELTYDFWLLYVRAAIVWDEERKKQHKEAGK